MSQQNKKPAPELFEDLEFRGIIKQVTDPDIAKLLKEKPLTLYIGFDPTADTLHVGSLLPLLTLKRFQQAGHRAIALVGGATGMIGDPSGKTHERSLMTKEQLKANQEGIKKIFAKFLDLSGDNPAIIANNADWFENITFIDFLRDVGKHFTVNHMMAKESVRARLEDREHGISYTEFSYMLLQSYDFYVLHNTEGCTLQMGGSDQWGNITAGIDLIRKMKAARGEPETEVYGITFPLVSKADGTKFGKSEKGNIWLDPNRTSPYQLYQFFIQTSDTDVMTYIRYFTFLDRKEILCLEESLRKEPEKREAQKTLARELTRLVHGQKELDRVEKATQALFGTEITTVDAKILQEAFADAPATEKEKASLAAGIPIIDVLVETGLCNSKGASRKEISAGGVYVNNTRITDIAGVINEKHLIADQFVLLRKGKKNYHLLKFR